MVTKLGVGKTCRRVQQKQPMLSPLVSIVEDTVQASLCDGKKRL